MSKVKRIFIALLIISIFCCTGLEAYAVTESQDGLSVTLTTDKQSYLPGEAINVSLLLTNGNSFPVSSVHAQVSAPEGYILSAGYAESMSTASLGAGKSLQLAIRYLEQNSVPVPLPTLGPDRVGVATGDQANLPLWIALAVVSLAALMLLALRKKIWKRFFCLLLCFVMLGGIAGPVYAANDQAQKTIRVATPVKVGNRDLTVQGVVSYTMGSEVSPSPTPTTVPSPTPTAQPSPTPAPSPSPSPSPVPGEYFTVSYQLNYEGAGEYLSQQVEKGSCAQEPTAPARDGYRFMGWYTEPACNRKYNFEAIIASNITLYSKWGKIENINGIRPEDMSRYVDDGLFVDISGAEHIQLDTESGLEYFDNEIILFVKEGTSEQEIAKLIAEKQGAIVGYDSYVNSFLVRFAVPKEIGELNTLLNEFKNAEIVEEAFLNYVLGFEADYYPSSDRAGWGDGDWTEIPEGENWGMEAIYAPVAWDYRENMDSVKVGVFDVGFDSSHGELKNVIYARAGSRIADHGTHVAGIIGAEFENGGICGICPTAKLAVIDTVYASEQMGNIFMWQTGVSYLLAKDYCDVSVINISMRIDDPLAYAASMGNELAQQRIEAYSRLMTVYLKDVQKTGKEFTICLAAGNQNGYTFFEDSSSIYGYYRECIEPSHNHKAGKTYYEDFYDAANPCKECTESMLRNIRSGGALAKWNSPLNAIEDDNIKKNIIVVGACKNDGNGQYSISSFSSAGSRVDVMAPGEDVFSTLSNNGYGPSAGTSMASPHVAGTAALLYALKPDISAEEVKSLIVSTATTTVSGSDKMMVNAGAAVKKLLRIINATVTDGNSPLSDVTVTIECIMAGFSEQSLTVKTDKEGKLDYQLPFEVASIKSITFSKEGYRDYKYPQELDVSSFNDLGEIVLSLIPVFDTVEIQATLLDAETGETVTGALIQAFSVEQETPVAETVSNDKGYFTIALPQFTTLSLKITCEGYTARELSIFLEGDSWTGDEEPGGEEAGSILYLQKADVFEGFAGGDGSMNNPYQIANAKQLNAIRDGLSAHYVLIDDIDLSAYSPWVPIGTGNNGFTGSLNGQGHTVSNLLINDESAKSWAAQNTWDKNKIYLGLFGVAAGTTNSVPWEPIWTTFKNINLSEVHVDITDEFINSSSGFNETYLGALCGFTNRARTEDCSSSGSINVSGTDLVQCYVGGLFGETYNGFVYRCSNYADVNADLEGTYVCCGGITGAITRFFGDEIANCTNYGDISCINNTSPDIFCGGIAGFADYRVFQCRNEGDIFTEAKAWGKPNSAGYRQQTGGIVGFFSGRPASDNASAEIIECENYGNVEAISFLGYSDGSNYGENDCTGGICGGFQCLSGFEDWSALIADCTNYAQSIHATRRVIESDGSSTVYASPWTGRIGGCPPSQTFLYSNNSSDPATLLNGAVCTENIGAETKNGTNLGEEDTEDENGELNISILEGTWSNGLPEDNYSGFYLTEFGSDGTVVQKGYRNIDRGRFEITGANTAVATFDDNYYDTTGVGYQKIADYSYTVTYTYDKYSDTLLADYSDVFENAANSNACDGTLSRWSGTPLHEQIKDIVLGTQEDDMQEQEPQDYQSFLTSQAYLDYAEGWNSSGETYVILDINQDGVDELIVNSPNDSGFMYSLVFTQNYEGQIVRLANEYHYGYIRYSAEHSAIEYSELNPTPDLGSSGFFAMSGAGLALIFSISWDNSEGTENSQIYYPSSGESVSISGEERQAYFASLQNLNWVSLT